MLLQIYEYTNIYRIYICYICMNIKNLFKAFGKGKKREKASNNNYSSLQTNWISILDWNSLFGCWSIKINLDDIFRLKKYNSDIANSIRIISWRVWIDGFTIIDPQGDILEEETNQDRYDYLKSMFTEQTWTFWKKKFFTQTFCAWENYLLPEKNVNSKILKFTTLDARSMVKKIDTETGDIVGFKQYNKYWKSPRSFSRDDLSYTVYEEDPENENLSMWKLDWIIFDALSDFESSKRNYIFFRNDAVPNAIFMLDENMNEKQFQFAIEQIKAKYSGSNNAHKFIANNAIKDVKILNVSNRDMEFLNQKTFTIEKIASAFWIPLEILGYVKNVGSYSKIIEIREDFYDWTLSEYDEYIESVINLALQKFEKDLLISFEWYTVKVDSSVKKNKEKIEEWQRKDIEVWIITVNQAREARWMEPHAEEWTNKPLHKTNLLIEEDWNNTEETA